MGSTYRRQEVGDSRSLRTASSLGSEISHDLSISSSSGRLRIEIQGSTLGPLGINSIDRLNSDHCEHNAVSDSALGQMTRSSYNVATFQSTFHDETRLSRTSTDRQ